MNLRNQENQSPYDLATVREYSTCMYVSLRACVRVCVCVCVCIPMYEMIMPLSIGRGCEGVAISSNGGSTHCKQ